VFGSGERLQPLAEPLRRLLRERHVAVETMATPHAAHTYNLLLAESRRVAAGLIAVD
jgi:uncharacterized protein